MKKIVLSPGFLVGLSARTHGGRKTSSTEIDSEREGARLTRELRTEIQIDDTIEYEAALKERNRLRGIITAVCIPSEFGPLCPADREAELESAIAEAKAGEAAWNAQAKYTFISISALPAVIAQDSELAATAITAQVRDLLIKTVEAIKAADPKEIRENCKRLRNMSSMLSPELAAKADKALRNARSIARKLVKRVEKAGENAAAVLAEINAAEVDSARFEFLELSPLPEGADDGGEPLPAADMQRFDALDDFAGLFDQPPTIPAADDTPDLDDDDDAPAVTVPELDDSAPEIDA